MMCSIVHMEGLKKVFCFLMLHDYVKYHGASVHGSKAASTSPSTPSCSPSADPWRGRQWTWSRSQRPSLGRCHGGLVPEQLGVLGVSDGEFISKTFHKCMKYQRYIQEEKSLMSTNARLETRSQYTIRLANESMLTYQCHCQLSSAPSSLRFPIPPPPCRRSP